METPSSDRRSRLARLSGHDPQVEAAMRLDLGVAATVVVLAAMVLGVALLLPSDQAPAVRALGAVLLVAAGVATIKLLSWARGWRWHYDRPTRGLSDGETFLIATAVVLASGGLYPLVGLWFLLAFLALPAAAILMARRER